VYEPPVELGATSSSPDALGNLGFKGDLEVCPGQGLPNLRVWTTSTLSVLTVGLLSKRTRQGLHRRHQPVVTPNAACAQSGRRDAPVERVHFSDTNTML
jgi:hypothetical protein